MLASVGHVVVTGWKPLPPGENPFAVEINSKKRNS
jgi:hypothetical protein